MTRYYCPGCWTDFEKDAARCPVCGLVIPIFRDSKDYAEKLIVALHHPEHSTPVRSAGLPGTTKAPRAVSALIDFFKRTGDITIARAAVKAPGELDREEARRFFCAPADHPAGMIRREVRRILGEKDAHRPDAK